MFIDLINNLCNLLQKFANFTIFLVTYKRALPGAALSLIMWTGPESCRVHIVAYCDVMLRNTCGLRGELTTELYRNGRRRSSLNG